MSGKLHIPKKDTRIQTRDISTAPTIGMFQPSPFGIPSPQADSPQQPDLKTALMRAERYGHSLSRMQFTEPTPVSLVQCASTDVKTSTQDSTSPTICSGGTGISQMKRNNRRRKGNHSSKPKSTRPHAQYIGRDDSQMNLKDLPKGNVRGYRVEVEQSDEKYGHLHISQNGQGHIYNPKPDPKEYENIGKGKKTPRKDPDGERYAKKFLKGRQEQPRGNMSWINFGEPSRAVEFHNQKSNNPNEQKKGNKFVIKSFETPHEVFNVIKEDSVHESLKKQHPTKAINVDRTNPNQLGLQQSHIELLNQNIVPGTARVEDFEELKSKYGLPKKEKKYSLRNRKVPDNGKPQNKYWHSKAARNNIGAMLAEMNAGEKDALAEIAKHETYDRYGE